MPRTNKMGKLGRLSQFSGLQTQPEPEMSAAASSERPPQVPNVQDSLSDSPPVDRQQLVPINIKITRKQQEWLAATARTIRQNNLAPVVAGERVFPQQLVGIAIELLQSRSIDWSNIQTLDDLRELLDLSIDPKQP
jgi:hypothetical protein